jgi:hypothetical protein
VCSRIPDKLLAPIILDGKSLVGGAITNAVFAYTEELLN